MVNIKWTEEPVDVNTNEIRRLAGFRGEDLERIVKLTFVNGFTDHISVELQQMERIMPLSMSDKN